MCVWSLQLVTLLGEKSAKSHCESIWNFCFSAIQHNRINILPGEQMDKMLIVK